MANREALDYTLSLPMKLKTGMSVSLIVRILIIPFLLVKLISHAITILPASSRLPH